MLAVLAATVLTLVGIPASATIAGFNQIATPEIQPQGVLSINCQTGNKALENATQLQLELGVTESVGVAVFQTFSPCKTLFNAELALVNRKRFIVSTGLLGTDSGTQYQPFVEGCYSPGKACIIGGIQWQEGACLAVFGFSYQATQRLLLTSDYISGSENYATVGFTYVAITRSLSFNTALHVSNSDPHGAFALTTVTWDIDVW